MVREEDMPFRERGCDIFPEDGVILLYKHSGPIKARNLSKLRKPLAILPRP